jgi:hypothetical protein
MAIQFQTIKSVLNGGEMSPLMDGRTDSEKYATGCRLLENFIVRPYGGIFKRPGTRFGTAGSDVNDTIRLIPFRRSTDINFVLAFKENAINVWSYNTGTFTLVTTLTTTYADTDIRDIHYCQINDVMFLTHGDYAPQRITRATDGTWSIETVPFQFAPALDPPDDAVTMKIVYDANTWVTATSYSIGDFVLYLDELYRCKTANSDVSFTSAKWDKAVYRSPWNVGQTYVAGDVVEYFGSNYFWKGASTAATSANRPGVGADWVLITITDYRLIASSATFDADEVGSTWQLSPGANSVGRVVTENFGTGAGTVTSAALFIQGSFIARTVWAAGSAPTLTTLQLQESLDRINFTTIKEWRIQVATEGTISYTAEAPNTGGWYRFVAVRDTGASSSATDWMTIEPIVGKLDIPFKIESYTSTTEVKGIPKLAVDSLIPNEVIGFTFPVWRKGAFSASRGYPKTVCFHDQRLWFAGTETEPMRLWGSQTDDFYTFLTGTLETSGIDVTLAATQANDIEWITSFKRTMVIGTTGEEWTMDSGEQDAALSPSNVRLRRWSRYGSSKLQPVLAGDALLWLTRDNRLREFAYVFEKDGYSAPDMTLLAEHIPGRSDVIGMAYSQSPDPIVWLMHENGQFSGFTYDRENNVTAWHRHRLGSNRAPNGTLIGTPLTVLSVCTLYSQSTEADSMVFLAESSAGAEALLSIDGEVMISAMTSANQSAEVWYMDSYSTHSGVKDTDLLTFTDIATSNPTFFINNAFLALGYQATRSDGSPVEAETAGTITKSAVFQFDGSAPPSGSYVIGFSYNAFAIPNRLEVPLQSGTSQMNKWRIVSMSFRLWRSYYGQIWAGVDEYDYTNLSRINISDADEFPFPPSDEPPGLNYVTGQTLPQPVNFNHAHNAMPVIVSRHAFRFNLLSIIYNVEVGDISGAP